MLLDEDHRLALSQEFDCLWSSSWDRSTVNLLCSAATKRYNTAYASFSIFDKSYEIFKYESGFNVSKNDRSVSIAAHALYTPDIMAIHDTHEVCYSLSRRIHFANVLVRIGDSLVTYLLQDLHTFDSLPEHPYYLLQELHWVSLRFSPTSLAILFPRWIVERWLFTAQSS